MITVVAIIIVLAGLIISTAGYAQKKAAGERAFNEIKAMSAQLDAYKIDNGTFPRTELTDGLDPRKDWSALSEKYRKPNIDLYSALTGDYEPAGDPDGKPEADAKVYYAFERSKLSTTKDNQGNIQKVLGITDPFGQYYGYSTAGAKAEAEYRKKVQLDPTAEREKVRQGFNSTFDLWSTAGGTTEAAQAKWIKNWGGN